ncbi:MAG: AAA family ATPase [Marmoricola sp.]
MTLLWEADGHVVDNVGSALGPEVTVVESGTVAVRTLHDDRAQALLVIGPGVPLSAALGVAEELRRDRPEVGVVLMRRRLDVSVLSQAARAGVREVVDAGDLGSLVGACRRSLELSERLGATATATPDGRVLTVFSAKGGAGKTALSVNMGAQLARRGTRTLLVDLDLAFGDDAIALGLAPERSSLDLVAMAGGIDVGALRSVVASHTCGLDLLCAPPHPSDADAVTPPVIAEALRVARREYDVVVVDTPPSFDERVIAAFDLTDLCLVLTTPEIASLKNLRLALDTLDLLGQPADLRRIVLNRARAKTGVSARDVAQAVHTGVDAQVPESGDVGRSMNRGVPLVLERAKHPVAAAVRRLLDLAELPTAPAAETPSPGGAEPEPATPAPRTARHRRVSAPRPRTAGRPALLGVRR